MVDENKAETLQRFVHSAARTGSVKGGGFGQSTSHRDVDTCVTIRTSPLSEKHRHAFWWGGRGTRSRVVARSVAFWNGSCWDGPSIWLRDRICKIMQPALGRSINHAGEHDTLEEIEVMPGKESGPCVVLHRGYSQSGSQSASQSVSQSDSQLGVQYRTIIHQMGRRVLTRPVGMGICVWISRR